MKHEKSSFGRVFDEVSLLQYISRGLLVVVTVGFILSRDRQHLVAYGLSAHLREARGRLRSLKIAISRTGMHDLRWIGSMDNHKSLKSGFEAHF